MALLTKSIGIVTPLVLSIVVVVARRLISYNERSLDRIIHQTGTRQVANCIVHESDNRYYCTRDVCEICIVHELQWWGREEKEMKQSNVSAYSEVQLNCNSLACLPFCQVVFEADCTHFQAQEQSWHGSIHCCLCERPQRWSMPALFQHTGHQPWGLNSSGGGKRRARRRVRRAGTNWVREVG